MDKFVLKSPFAPVDEQRKAIEAERIRAEQVRQQYESQLPLVKEMLDRITAGQFSDIKTQADVTRLAAEDPIRYLQWQAHRDEVAANHREIQAAQQRQMQEHQSRWTEFASKADKEVFERIPELADPEKRSKIQEGARALLTDVGFKEAELQQSWNGELGISLRDPRMQEIVNDARKYREAQANAKKAISQPKPLPPVQKPGVAAPKGASNSELIQTLSAKLDKTGSAKDAAALLAAKRASRR